MKAKYRMHDSQNRVQAPPSRITKSTLPLQPFRCRYCLRWWSNFGRYRRHITRSHHKRRSRISKVRKGVRLYQSQNTDQVTHIQRLPVIPGNGTQQTKKEYGCAKCKKRFLKRSAFEHHKCISDAQSGSSHQKTHIQPKANHDTTSDVIRLKKRQHSLHRWTCSECTLGFATFDTLKAHELIVHNSHCTCDHCKMQLGRNSCLKRHSKLLHSVDIATKDNGQKTTVTKKAKKRHSKMVHSVDFATKDNRQQTTEKVPKISVAYECDKCKKRFLMLTEFDQHKCISDTQSGSTHQASGIQRKCNHCNMRLAATSDVARHEKRQHSLLQWMCRKCGMGFATNDDLNEHKTIHADEASGTSQPQEDGMAYRSKVAGSLVAIECDKCKLQFPSLARFSSHKCILDTRNGVAILCATSIPRNRNSHPQCEHCNRHFGTKPNLERSVVVMGLTSKDNRENDKKFVTLIQPHGHITCHLCGASFWSKKGLNIHISVAHPECPCTICGKCGEHFMTKKQLARHDQMCVRNIGDNEDSPKFLCNLCNRNFASKQELDEHNKTHFQCGSCGQQFISREACLLHAVSHSMVKANSSQEDLDKYREIQHHKDTEMVCTYCDRKFEGKIAFSLHMRRHEHDNRFECMQCLEKFLCREELTQHRTSHVDKEALSCHQCNKAFKSRRALQKHVNDHELDKQETEIVCMYCDMKFTREFSLALHMKHHGGATPFECMQCLEKFSCREELTQHRTSHVDKKALSCYKCNKAFQSRTSLQMHVNNHERKKQCHRSKYNDQKRGNKTQKPRRHIHKNILCELVCMYCDRKIKGNAALAVHMKSHAGETPFECLQCRDKFASREELTQHRTCHVDDENALKCRQCDKTFETQYEVTKHLCELVCMYCDRKFKGKAGLCSHIRIHVGETPFECMQCGDKFASREEMTQHRTNHVDDKIALKCHHCVTTFPTLAKLQKHLSKFTTGYKRKTYKCEKCETKYDSNYQRDIHMREAHTGEEIFKCTNCGKKFLQESELSQHVETGCESLRCEECDKLFTRKSFLKNHMISIHSKEMPPHLQCKYCLKSASSEKQLQTHIKRVHEI
ncbi:uncharacterized protein [Amphiura filiformis]|uniref:uncharacterized protein n=1 Tax=Amphiura filiformis TaxID=82378 RepID=UPI003B2281C0